MHAVSRQVVLYTSMLVYRTTWSRYCCSAVTMQPRCVCVCVLVVPSFNRRRALDGLDSIPTASVSRTDRQTDGHLLCTHSRCSLSTPSASPAPPIRLSAPAVTRFCSKFFSGCPWHIRTGANRTREMISI